MYRICFFSCLISFSAFLVSRLTSEMSSSLKFTLSNFWVFSFRTWTSESILLTVASIPGLTRIPGSDSFQKHPAFPISLTRSQFSFPNLRPFLRLRKLRSRNFGFGCVRTLSSFFCFFLVWRVCRLFRRCWSVFSFSGHEKCKLFGPPKLELDETRLFRSHVVNGESLYTSYIKHTRTSKTRCDLT